MSAAIGAILASPWLRLERRDGLRRLRLRAADAARPLLVIGLLVGAGMVAAILTSPWSLDLTLRHLAAAAGCPVAQAVGLAPARLGEPGLWTLLDPTSTAGRAPLGRTDEAAGSGCCGKRESPAIAPYRPRRHTTIRKRGTIDKAGRHGIEKL